MVFTLHPKLLCNYIFEANGQYLHRKRLKTTVCYRKSHNKPSGAVFTTSIFFLSYRGLFVYNPHFPNYYAISQFGHSLLQLQILFGSNGYLAVGAKLEALRISLRKKKILFSENWTRKIPFSFTCSVTLHLCAV